MLAHQVHALLPRGADDFRSHHHLVLLLQHHPPDWLSDLPGWEARVEVAGHITLFGHMHDNIDLSRKGKLHLLPVSIWGRPPAEQTPYGLTWRQGSTLGPALSTIHPTRRRRRDSCRQPFVLVQAALATHPLAPGPIARILARISGDSMAQVTLYMDEETLAQTRAAADAAGTSVSAWLTAVAKERLRQTWPAHIVELAGAWPDLPDADEIRRDQGADLPRESW